MCKGQVCASVAVCVSVHSLVQEVGNGAFSIAGGRSCYQCASSSVTPGQSIVPLLCSRRLSGRSMLGSSTRRHAHNHNARTSYTKHDLHLLPLVALSLFAVPYRGEQLYDTHNDALIPNAACMQTHRMWRAR